MLFVNPSKIRLLGRNYFLPIWVPTQVFFVFFFYFYFKRSEFRLGFFLFILAFEVRVPTRTSYRILLELDQFRREFEFSKTRFSFHFHYFEKPGSDSSFLLFIYIYIYIYIYIRISEVRVPTRTSFWSLRIGPIVPVEESSFKNSISHSLFYFEKSGFRLGFSPFYIYIYIWSLEFRLGLPIGTNRSLPIVTSENSSSQTRFSFILLFWKTGFRLGFSLFIYIFIFPKFRVPTRTSFWIPMLVLEPIVTSRIRVLKNSILIHSFILKKPGSDSDFLLFTYILISGSFGFRLGLPFGSDARIGTNCYVENSSSQTRFSFILLFWKTGFRLGFSLLYILIFEVPGSDSDFLLDPMLVLEPIVMSRIRVLKLDSHSSFLSLFLKTEFRLGFSLLYILIFEVPGSDSTSFWIQCSYWNQLSCREFEFSNSILIHLFYLWKTGFRLGFFPFVYSYFAIRVPTRISLFDPMLVLDQKFSFAFPSQVKGQTWTSPSG